MRPYCNARPDGRRCAIPYHLRSAVTVPHVEPSLGLHERVPGGMDRVERGIDPFIHRVYHQSWR